MADFRFQRTFCGGIRGSGIRFEKDKMLDGPPSIKGSIFIAAKAARRAMV